MTIRSSGFAIVSILRIHAFCDRANGCVTQSTVVAYAPPRAARHTADTSTVSRRAGHAAKCNAGNARKLDASRNHGATYCLFGKLTTHACKHRNITNETWK